MGQGLFYKVLCDYCIIPYFSNFVKSFFEKLYIFSKLPFGNVPFARTKGTKIRSGKPRHPHRRTRKRYVNIIRIYFAVWRRNCYNCARNFCGVVLVKFYWACKRRLWITQGVGLWNCRGGSPRPPAAKQIWQHYPRGWPGFGIASLCEGGGKPYSMELHNVVGGGIASLCEGGGKPIGLSVGVCKIFCKLLPSRFACLLPQWGGLICGNDKKQGNI